MSATTMTALYVEESKNEGAEDELLAKADE